VSPFQIIGLYQRNPIQVAVQFDIAMPRILPCLVLAALTGAAFAADPANVIESVYSSREPKPDLDPKSSFWKKVGLVTIDNDYMGEPMPKYRSQVRSRWTKDNLYLLFVCPYEQFWLKPDPDTKNETNQLWNFDVAEAFIGSDFQQINRYREFEVSRAVSGSISISIAETSVKVAAGSGTRIFKSKTRIDEKQHLWYAEMIIPWNSLQTAAPVEGGELRANFLPFRGPNQDEPGVAAAAQADLPHTGGIRDIEVKEMTGRGRGLACPPAC
jgi:hypothetical protein